MAVHLKVDKTCPTFSALTQNKLKRGTFCSIAYQNEQVLQFLRLTTKTKSALFRHYSLLVLWLQMTFAEQWQVETRTGLYRSCAALANFSGTFDSILFQAEFIAEKVWFGYMVWKNRQNKWFWFAFIEFGLVRRVENRQKQLTKKGVLLIQKLCLTAGKIMKLDH